MSKDFKICYAEKSINCLRKVFIDARSDAVYQSIDKSMTKFKGRSSIQQYMPTKPVKCGIKLCIKVMQKQGMCMTREFIVEKKILTKKEH